MNRPLSRLSSAKPVLAAAIALGALGAATAANAHTDVVFSVGIPAPAYVAPAPVYVQPEPVFVPEPVYAPAPVVYYGYGRRYVSPGVRYEQRYYDGRGYYRQGWRDSDRDGVPNRFDHAPFNPHRR
jgi:hypothetical protein